MIHYDWAVIGAGPAGIAAVGQLIDNGVKPELILWVDPQFQVGDLGGLWRNVSSNTKVQLFNQFLLSVQSFSYAQVQQEFALTDLPPEETCVLSEVVNPLQWVSDTLCKQVYHVKAMIHHIDLLDRMWSLSSDSETYRAHRVILATGSVPSSFNYPGIPVTPFDVAVDKARLAMDIDSNYTYAVFGSSHSAMMILRHLVELGAHQIINFYQSPNRYALEMGDWILFDNTGLKGQTADWARTYIDGQRPSNLVRYPSHAHHIQRYLPDCDRVIYAVGFERRDSLRIGEQHPIHYDPHVGIIGPGLFGIGIAYPEKVTDRFGRTEWQVGLWKFMTYLKKILPIWLKYSA